MSVQVLGVLVLMLGAGCLGYLFGSGSPREVAALLVLPQGYALPREAAAAINPLIRSCTTDDEFTRTYRLNLPYESEEDRDE